MESTVFNYYRQAIERRCLYQGHNRLSQYLIADLSTSVFTCVHRRAIQSVSAYLPFNQRMIENPYLMQGGGDYYIMEVNFTSGKKSIIQIEHIYEYGGAMPRPQKHGRLVDMMIRLNYLKTKPEYANAETYLVLVSDGVMVNYNRGLAYEEKRITPDWVAHQVGSFQDAIIRRFKEYLQAVGIVIATHYIPVYTSPDETFGLGVWQIT